MQDLLFISTFWNQTAMCLDTNLFLSTAQALGGPFPSRNVLSSMLGIICQLFHWEFPLPASFVLSFYYLPVHHPRPAILNHSPILILRFFSFFYFLWLLALLFYWILHFYCHIFKFSKAPFCCFLKEPFFKKNSCLFFFTGEIYFLTSLRVFTLALSQVWFFFPLCGLFSPRDCYFFQFILFSFFWYKPIPDCPYL